MKLSIITINRNNAAGLRKTIESVVSQTFTDFEYIIIDGASTDESVDVLKEYADKISFWVSEPDNGIYNAMNKGILKAKGEYLLFLNSGDWLYDEMVLDEIFKNEVTADIIYGNTMITKDDGTGYKGGPCTDNITAYQLITSSMPHQASFFLRTLFDKYGKYDENYKIVSDWKFYFELIIMNNVSVKYLDIIVAFFDINGISNTMCDTDISERKQVLSEFLPQKAIDDYEYAHKNISSFIKKRNKLDNDVHLVIMNNTIRSHWLSRKLQTGLYYMVKKYEKIIKSK